LPRDVPIQMLNLIRYRDWPPIQRGTKMPARAGAGRAPIRNMARPAGRFFSASGACVVWRGAFQTILTGPADEHWDAAFIAQYPNAGAFLEMVTDPDYRLAVVNRQAAVQTSRLIRFAPLDGDSGSFG
jgi:hypothetical protein